MSHPEQPLTRCLGSDLVEASHAPGALKYLTRGLTSNIHTFTIATPSTQLEARLVVLKASTNEIIVKTVDTDDEARPHSVEKELRLLEQISRATSSQGQQYVLSLLDTSEDCPDDFTTLRRLYLPRYASNLTEWLDSEASISVHGPASRRLSHSARLIAATRLSQQLFSALDFLHSNSIFHRDIKPANILLTTSDASSTDFEIRLCDFGTAWALSEEGSNGDGPWPSDVQKELRRPKTCSTSTHPYTPPEMLFSPTDGYNGAKVDVWESACVVAELFTPTAPVEGEIASGPSGAGARQQSTSHASDEVEQEDDPFGPPLTDENAGPPRRGMQLFGGQDDEEEDDEEDEFWRREEKSLFSHQGTSLFDRKTREGTLAEAGPVPLGSKRPRSPSGPPLTFRHATLFRGQQGDLGLASDIFDLLGLPEAHRGQAEWPEALHFRPALERFPFPRRSPPDIYAELRRRLPLLYDEGCSGDDQQRTTAIEDLFIHSWRLSASRRWDAQQALSRLEGRGQR